MNVWYFHVISNDIFNPNKNYKNIIYNKGVVSWRTDQWGEGGGEAKVVSG